MTEFSFTLVDVGEGLEEAEITEWFFGPGDTIEADQILVSVETAKSVVELPVPVGGRIASIAGDPGTVVPVGGLLATIETPVGQAGDSRTPAFPAPDESEPGESAVARKPEEVRPDGRRRARAAPLVRRLAREHGIDLSDVEATGPRGRVTKGDLLTHVRAVANPVAVAAEEPLAAAAPRASVIAFKGVRAKIAEVLTESASTVPHIYDWRTVDATGLLALRRRLGASETTGAPSLIALLARITLAALRRHPMMYARLDIDAAEIHVGGTVDLGLAITGPAGLVVPVVGAADGYSMSELSAELRRLTDAALARTLAPSEMGAAAFTLNNLGPLGADHGSPLLRVGETGAAAFGVIRDGVIARDGAPTVAAVMGVTVVGDHRVVDGSDLCAFANSLVGLVEHPELLVMEL